ncbi:MAG: hypothetical protein DRQ10_03740 [Candidatus Hydrothermota bacterium]|nr:MAG: hypothetical protein DRQ10_03740 [Candidatus Hydrothermae bacterium]
MKADSERKRVRNIQILAVGESLQVVDEFACLILQAAMGCSKIYTFLINILRKQGESFDGG